MRECRDRVRDRLVSMDGSQTEFTNVSLWDKLVNLAVAGLSGRQELREVQNMITSPSARLIAFGDGSGVKQFANARGELGLTYGLLQKLDTLI